MSWSEVDFESLFASQSRNGVYKSKDHHGTGVPIVNMGELFAFNRIGDQPMSLIRMSDSEMDKSGLINGDLLFGRRSLVEEGAGKCSMVYKPTEPLTFESSIIRVRLDRTVADPEFFFNYFRSPIGRSRIRAIVGGAAVKGIRGSDLKLIKVHLPPLAEQIAIRLIAATYDDLITINQRRIALLEDAARRLYHEWFVHLRFPGHETVPVKDGVPKGWRRALLGELIDFKKGKKPLQLTTDAIDGLLPHILMDVVRGSPPSEFVAPEGLVEVGASDTIMVMDGSSSGEVFLGYAGVIGSTLGRYRIHANQCLSPFWLYLTFRHRMAELQGNVIGAAIPHANKDAIKQMEILMPDSVVSEMFDSLISQLFEQIGTLQKSVITAARARDLLLPKLMSGQIDVSGIPLPEEVAA